MLTVSYYENIEIHLYSLTCPVAILLHAAGRSESRRRMLCRLCKSVYRYCFTGNTYPGAQVPFGMVQLSPDNGLPGWDRISGYFIPTVRLPVSVTPISQVRGRAICMTFPSCR